MAARHVTTLSCYVNTRREELCKERDEDGPRLSAQAREMADAAKDMPSKRAFVLCRKRLERMSAQLCQQSTQMMSGEALQRFERRAAPFIQASDQYASGRPDGPPSAKRPRILRTEQPHSGALGGIVKRAPGSRHATVLNEYLASERLEAPQFESSHADVCQSCGTQMVLHVVASTMVCPQCAHAVPHMDNTRDTQPYSDTTEMTAYFYKRPQHFEERLAQLQAKETTEVPKETLQAVMQALYDRGVRTCDAITIPMVRATLKDLKMRRAYEHVAQIYARITGCQPPRLLPETEELTRLMFLAIQVPFQKHKPKTRKNFLSYTYCLYKFLQLQAVPQHLLDNFALLKGQDKLAKQDAIFEKICADPDIDWEFIPSRSKTLSSV